MRTKWISVKDKLPELETAVLVAIEYVPTGYVYEIATLEAITERVTGKVGAWTDKNNEPLTPVFWCPISTPIA